MVNTAPPTPDDIVNLDGLKAQLAILEHCRTKKAELAELETQAKSAIQNALGDREYGTVDGRIACTWKIVRRKTLDQKLLQQRHPEVAEECTVTAESRRFLTGDLT